MSTPKATCINSSPYPVTALDTISILSPQSSRIFLSCSKNKDTGFPLEDE